MVLTSITKLDDGKAVPCRNIEHNVIYDIDVDSSIMKSTNNTDEKRDDDDDNVIATLTDEPLLTDEDISSQSSMIMLTPTQIPTELSPEDFVYGCIPPTSQKEVHSVNEDSPSLPLFQLGNGTNPSNFRLLPRKEAQVGTTSASLFVTPYALNPTPVLSRTTRRDTYHRVGWVTPAQKQSDFVKDRLFMPMSCNIQDLHDDSNEAHLQCPQEENPAKRHKYID